MLFCLSVPTCGGVGEALLTLVDAVDDNLNTGTRMQRSLLLNGMERALSGLWPSVRDGI
jgi:hypothetical protein